MEAWRLYNVPSSVILFIIEDVTFNICDQRFHEFEIRSPTPPYYDKKFIIIIEIPLSGSSVLTCLL